MRNEVNSHWRAVHLILLPAASHGLLNWWQPVLSSWPTKNAVSTDKLHTVHLGLSPCWRQKSVSHTLHPQDSIVSYTRWTNKGGNRFHITSHRKLQPSCQISFILYYTVWRTVQNPVSASWTIMSAAKRFLILYSFLNSPCQQYTVMFCITIWSLLKPSKTDPKFSSKNHPNSASVPFYP